MQFVDKGMKRIELGSHGFILVSSNYEKRRQVYKMQFCSYGLFKIRGNFLPMRFLAQGLLTRSEQQCPEFPQNENRRRFIAVAYYYYYFVPHCTFRRFVAGTVLRLFANAITEHINEFSISNNIPRRSCLANWAEKLYCEF